MLEQAARESVIHYACAMHKDGLTVADSGNISVRFENDFLITPSGVAYESLRPQDIVRVNLEGVRVAGDLAPSSEWRIHRDLYVAKSEIHAVVHAHAPAATALSVCRKALPAFHYMVALFGGYEVPCADYATFGTKELSDAVLAVMQTHTACLMANHGMVVTANNLPKAYTRALELESLCDQYSKALSIGEVILLTDQQMDEARQAFAGYGSYSNNKA